MIGFFASHAIFSGVLIGLAVSVGLVILLDAKSNHKLLNMISGALLFSGLSLTVFLLWISLHELTDSELLALKEAEVMNECTLRFTERDTARKIGPNMGRERILSYRTVYQNHALCKQIEHENDSSKERTEKLRKLRD